MHVWKADYSKRERHVNFDGNVCHGSVKVALSRIKNPSKSPFTKGDFQIPPLEKGEGGFLDKRNQFIEGKN